MDKTLPGVGTEDYAEKVYHAMASRDEARGLVTPWVARVAGILCILMSAFTALAFVETDEWWIRILDFPRVQIAGVLIVALFIYSWTRQHGTGAVVVSAIALSALSFQVWMILPYTPIWSQQMISASACPAKQRVRFLLANVLQDNRNSKGLLQLVDQANPDIILLTEIDQWWAREVEGLARTHPRIILEPRSNTYGIGLYSRHSLLEGKVRYLVDEKIPSILTRVALPDGTLFSLWAVHPSPPRSGDDTEKRDAELLIVAKEAAEVEGPTVVSAVSTYETEFGGLRKGGFLAHRSPWRERR